MSEEKTYESKYAPLWEEISREMEKEDTPACKLTIIEAEKIFQKALKDRNLPGKDAADKIKNYARLFSNPDKLRYARTIQKKLVTEIGLSLDRDDAEEIVETYRQAIEDLEKIDFGTLPLKEKVRLFLKRNFYSIPALGKKMVAALVIFSLATFFLTETDKGRTAAARIVDANNYIYYHIIPAILTVIGLAFLAVVALYIYQEKKK